MLIQQVHEVTEELIEAFQRLMPQLSATMQPPTREALQTLIDFPASTLLVARMRESDPIIGAATLAVVRAPSGVHARLEDVIVDETARGQGVGEALTREVIRLAKEAGADYIALTSNPLRAAANRLYQRVGFTKWETNVYRLGLRDGGR